MKFYIASGLENKEPVRKLAARLKSAGWTHTYDWTQHGAVRDQDKLQKISQVEMQGVLAADIVIVLLPGARGTHTELGIALATQKKLVLNDETGKAFSAEELPCSFYHHPSVWRTTLDTDRLANLLLMDKFFGGAISNMLSFLRRLGASIKERKDVHDQAN